DGIRDRNVTGVQTCALPILKQVLDFEKPIVDLKEKIAELKAVTENSDIDLTEEIRTLEKRLDVLENDIYGHLKPWDRVQMARHQIGRASGREGGRVEGRRGA